MNEDESFFESDVVQQELTDIQETYTQLLKISAGLADFSPKERLEHNEKTLELIAKQKVFYSRLALASLNISGDENDEEASFVKEKIDTLSAQYSGGLNLMLILQQMEDKLRAWRKELKDAES